MDSRRVLVHRVLQEGWSVSSAAAEAGVSRESAYRWIRRAGSPEGLQELSRRPHNSPGATSPDLVEELLGLKGRYPAMGPLKLSALMEGRVHPRTAARVLKRHRPSPEAVRKPAEEPLRFERANPHELWQVDHKGMARKGHGYEVLSVLDDASRFLLALAVLPDQRFETTWAALWEVFGEHGLPLQLLSDNGPAFGTSSRRGLSAFDARLLRAGVEPSHGRPYHPQTQGKVERFHGTLERELGERLYAPSAQEAQETLAGYRDFYNWTRPHQALGQRPPGTVCAPSPRPRPPKLPEAWSPKGSQVRKVDGEGHFSFKGQDYKAGKGLVRQPVGVLEDPVTGTLEVWYCSRKFAQLEHLKVSRMSCPEM